MRSFGFEDVEFSLRAWRAGFSLTVVGAVAIPHVFRAAAPFRKPALDFVHNALRTIHLHFIGGTKRALINHFQSQAEYMPALRSIDWRDLYRRRRSLRLLSRRSMREYSAKFGGSAMELGAAATAIRGAAAAKYREVV
jgi:GT2 family glycosyltransferase